MKRINKAISVVLATIVTVGLVLIPVDTVSAATYSGTCGDNLTWEFDTDTNVLTISGTGEMTDYTSSMASGDAPWFVYRTQIKAVIINPGVTTIGNIAFYGCKLETVTIPGSVTSIGRRAFYQCTALESVTIPDGVKTIGESAFGGCSALESVTIPNSVTSIGMAAFIYCASLKSVIIPDSVTTIENGTFLNCSALETVTIGEGVTSVGGSAFMDCSALESVTFMSNTPPSFGTGAFGLCDNLSTIYVPKDAKAEYQSVSQFYGMTIVEISICGDCGLIICKDCNPCPSCYGLCGEECAHPNCIQIYICEKVTCSDCNPLGNLIISAVTIGEDGIIEITNPTKTFVFTKGLFLSNAYEDDKSLFKLQLPAVIIRPGKTIQISIMDCSSDKTLKRMKTNFDLNYGDNLYLVKPA